MAVTKELVEVDSNGVSEVAHFDGDGNLLGLEWSSDVEPIIDANKAAQNDGTRGWGKSREWRHIAEIPAILMLKWATEQGVAPHIMNSREGLEEVALRMVRDPDYRFLRRDV